MNGNDHHSATSPIESEVTLDDVWNEAVREITQIDPKTENWKNLSLPLARIKKIMKSEDFVTQELERERQRQAMPGAQVERDRQRMRFMISQEGPMLMAKACELMVKRAHDSSLAAYREKQAPDTAKADIHAAVGEDDMFDFLIDIVPRGMAAPVFDGNQQNAASETQNVARDPPPQETEPAVQAQDPSNQYGTLLQQMQQGVVDGRQMQVQHNSDTQQNSTMPTWNDTGL